MTTASATASTPRTSHNATRAAWLFHGRTELALVVNWHQATMEGMLHDLKIARELEYVKDLIQIARLRLFSAQCSMALARCRTEQDTA
jgi:hypothetical protein